MIFETDYQKIILRLMAESFQRDRFAGRKAQATVGGKRSKEDEIDNAKNSAINFPFRLNGWTFDVSIHAASQSHDRRPDMSKDDWKKFHRNVIYDSPKKMKNGYYLFYSKSFEQGYVTSVRGKNVRIVTVLPKGRSGAKDNTTKIIIESFGYELEYIEVS